MTRRGTHRYQSTITALLPTLRGTVPNLCPSGDPLTEKREGTLRLAYQNVRGVSDARGLTTPVEIEAMEHLQVDIMGMSETNRPWTPHHRYAYDTMMQLRFRSSRTFYSSAPSHDHTQKYQPGGNLLTINGHTTGRIVSHGSDPLGRFCWTTLRGRRDEGVLLITAYRVCHTLSDNPGPHTAFSQQYMAMREQGIQNPHPRRQILLDLTALISRHRSQGFSPIVMMDANGDYHTKDTDLRTFLTNAGLGDPFYDKFKLSPPTNVHGSSRIDYIFTDPSFYPSIHRIGYLGTHDGAFSDHVVGYVDFDERSLFAGLLHRPLPVHSREILLEQEDKVQDFLHALLPLLDAHTIDTRVFKLAASYSTEGATSRNVDKYNLLYGQFLELVNAAAKNVGRKKYGYMRSPTLGLCGRRLLALKQILDCCQRRAPFTPSLHRLLSSLDMDPREYDALSEAHLRTLVRKQRAELWECQKRGEDLRQDWLASVAQERARAAGDKDWERRLKVMLRRARESATNRKLNVITKGLRGVLDRIQVPTHEWFHSASSNELFHYETGVFAAHPWQHENIFYAHHTLKVLPPDVTLAEVVPTDTGWALLGTSATPTSLWRDVTSQPEIESILLARNQRHLEQTHREGGQSTVDPISRLRQHHGYNNMSTAALAGETIQYDLSPELTAFFRSLQRRPSEVSLTPVAGIITSADVQHMFCTSRERTSSDPRTPNYSIWKCLVRSDRIAGFLGVLLSLPFTYGFVNKHWTHMTDFMIEKKPGVRQIHTLRIIGKVAAEFNTCLKFLIGKQARDNFEQSLPCDDQHGFRPHRSSVDAAMIKLLTFEAARMQKATMGSFQNDMTGHFDRMWPDLTSIFATKFGVSQGIMLSINKTIDRLQRNVETSLGLSSATYSQRPLHPRLGGMVQGKADVPQLSTQQLDIMLTSHRHIAPGLCLRSPTLLRAISRTDISYADDTDGLVSIDTTDTTSLHSVVELLRQNAQSWSTLADICGGLIALHKCNWHLIAWELVAGHLSLIQSPPTTLVMRDYHGSHSTIQYLPPSQPNVGLGFHLCPNGDQGPHYRSVRDALASICRTVSTAHLREHELHLLLRQRLIPKLSYALHGSSFTEQQCDRLNSLLRASFLPGLRLNRNFPSAVLYGPVDYGGMEFPELYTLQDQVQLDYLLKQLRWDKTVANDFLVTLDSIQLCSGFTSPLLESVTTTLDYLEPSYIIDIRRRLAELGAHMWIEDAWTPPLQRVGDRSLMEQFCNISGITRAKLRRANAVRLYLRVLTIADLTDVAGTHIRDGMLDGDWQAGSDLKWPYQPKPPKAFWSTFRWCLRHTFCSRQCPHQPASYAMQLDDALGCWLLVPRTTWYSAY